MPLLRQSADLYRRRALEAAEQISCLQEFAHARDPSDLSPLFHDDRRLAEAAVRAGLRLSEACMQAAHKTEMPASH